MKLLAGTFHHTSVAPVKTRLIFPIAIDLLPKMRDGVGGEEFGGGGFVISESNTCNGRGTF